MAIEADIRGAIVQQSGRVRRMRVMANLAISFFNRVMYILLTTFGSHLCVTGIAQILYRLLKQACESADMRAVAVEAISIGSRLMFYPFLKSIVFMARKTNISFRQLPPFMTVVTVIGRKRIMLDWIK